MAKRKLNYRFHNPNPVEVTADYILKVMIEANTEKVEKILQENMHILFLQRQHLPISRKVIEIKELIIHQQKWIFILEE